MKGEYFWRLVQNNWEEVKKYKSKGRVQVFLFVLILNGRSTNLQAPSLLELVFKGLDTTRYASYSNCQGY